MCQYRYNQVSYHTEWILAKIKQSEAAAVDQTDFVPSESETASETENTIELGVVYNFNNSLRLHPSLAILRANILLYV